MADEKIVLAEIDIETDKATAEIIKLRGEVSKLKEAQKELTDAGKENSAEYLKNEAAIKANTKEIQQNQTILTKAAQAQLNVNGSIAQMRAQLSAVSIQWAQQAKAYGENSEEAKKLYKQKADLTEAISREMQVTNDARMEVGKYEKAGMSLRAEMKQLIQEMAKMKLEGNDNTDAYGQMSLRAGQLRDSLDDVSRQTRTLASDTKGLDVAVQSFDAVGNAATLYQGAVALAGDENKALSEGLKKMMILQTAVSAAQKLQNTLQTESAFMMGLASAKTKSLAAAQTLYTIATSGATKGMKLFKLALIGTGIGALIVAIGALIANWEKLANLFSGAKKEAAGLNAEMERQKNISDEQNKSLDFQMKLKKAKGASDTEIAKLELEQAKKKQEDLKTEIAFLNKIAATGKASDEQLEARAAAYKRVTDLRRETILKEIELNNKLRDEELKRIDDAKKTEQERIDGINKARKERQQKQKEEDDIKKQNEEKEIQRLIKKMGDELNLYKAQNKSIIESKEELTSDLVNQEILRLEKIKKLEIDFLTEQNKKGLINDLELKTELINLEDAFLEKKNSLIESYDDIQSENKKARLIADLDNEFAIAEGNITRTLELERKKLVMLEQQEKEAAIKSGADITLIEKKFAKARTEIAKTEAKAKRDVALNLADNLVSVLGETSAIGKAAAVASTSIKTYEAAQGAYTSTVGVGGPVLASIAAGIAVASGLMNVRKILSIDPLKGSASGGGGSVGGGGLGAGAGSVVSATVGSGLVQRQFESDSMQSNNISNAIREGAGSKVLVVDDVTAKQSEQSKLSVLGSI